MSNGSRSLEYNIYLEASHVNIWGDGTGGSSQYENSSPPNGQNVAVTMYGRIPGGQSVPAGSYSDSLTVTIDF